MTQEGRNRIAGRLEEEHCSCIVWKDGRSTCHYGRGVKDLFRLLTEEPLTLAGAFVADKVVGKGAAALMVLGGVREVYAAVASTPALALLHENGIAAECVREVPHIVNRQGDGICPVELLCRDCASAADCLPLIRQFLAGLAATEGNRQQEIKE